VPPWGELGPHLIQCGLGRGLPPYQVASRSIQPFGRNRHGPKIGGCAPLGSWVVRPHLTQRRLGRGLPPYQVASCNMCPSLIQIGSKTAEKNCTNRQTNRHYENNGHLVVNQKLECGPISAQRDGRPAEYRWRLCER